ncbi:chloroplast envelope protein translocase family, partial [Micromonas pusilla CCMP1545]
ASTPPSSWYTDAAIIPAIEARAVFAEGWQAVGRVDQVSDVGDYFTGAVGNFLVVRGDDGDVRAFHNVCRHHAMEATCFRCPYHGWTYDDKGALTKATRLTGIEGFDVSDNGLKPLRVDTWGPFVFVNLGGDDASAPPPVNEWLGEAGERMRSAGVAEMTHVARREYELNCNWKVFCDNYLDGGYHVPFAHPELASGVSMKSYETTIRGLHSLQTVTAAAAAATDRVRDRDDRLGDAALYAFIHPNFMVNRYGKWLDTNWVIPTGAETCKVVFEYYLEKGVEGATEAFIEKSLAASDRIQREDTTLCEKVQEGVRSPGYGVGRYAPAVEAAMYHFHALL